MMSVEIPYFEEVLDAKVSDCPYCGCKRVVKHFHDDCYEEPDDYIVVHADVCRFRSAAFNQQE